MRGRKARKKGNFRCGVNKTKTECVAPRPLPSPCPSFSLFTTLSPARCVRSFYALAFSETKITNSNVRAVVAALRLPHPLSVSRFPSLYTLAKLNSVSIRFFQGVRLTRDQLAFPVRNQLPKMLSSRDKLLCSSLKCQAANIHSHAPYLHFTPTLLPCSGALIYLPFTHTL